jgi:hypothetical protein
MEQPLLLDVPAYNGVEDENQRFTLDEADAWLRSVAGVDAWDLDVAACAESNRARSWYGPPLDGRVCTWSGRVFCNPPWDNIEPWVEAAWRKFGADDERHHPEVIGMLLPLRTHMVWWQKWVERFRDGRDRCEGHPICAVSLKPREWRPALEVHHPPKRFKYGHPGNPRGIGCVEPNFQTVGLVWRRT